MKINALPGVFDILPNDPQNPWRNSHLWNHVEKTIRKTAEEFGYREIRTPIFEKTELFQRGVGESTDIVKKEMYTFLDKGERSLTLRPEGTASVVRSFIEHHLCHEAPVQKFYYIGPMFRYERAQAGRYRQHHQFGAEAIGNAVPEQDAELIDMLYTLYSRLGLKNLQVMINSIGDASCRKNYREALKSYLSRYFNDLSEDSKARFEKNPLRILDSKDPRDKDLILDAPSIHDFLSPECKEHFEKLQLLLCKLNIPYEINDKIVRGLDYYNRTVYEITALELGAQNSIGGGGRYDGLVKMLGGPDTPATGFATGIERVLQTMIGQGVDLPPPSPTIFLIPLGDEAKLKAFEIVHDLRKDGVKAQMDFTGRKLGKLMNLANQCKAKFVAVIGDDELEKKVVELKNMETGETMPAPLYHLSRILRIEAEGEDFVRIWQEMNTPFKEPAEAHFFLKKLEQSIKSTEVLTSELQTAMNTIKEIL